MIVYIDISEFLRTRITTGIQRVIREYLQRAIIKQDNINVIIYNLAKKNYQLLDNNEVALFLKDVKNYEFTFKKNIDLFKVSDEEKVFFDIDSVWNSFEQRSSLYKNLKASNFKIVNFIYDLIPILFPDLLKEDTRKNFQFFLYAVYKYSDLVFFDSISAKDDFDRLMPENIITRDIEKKVVYLGSDFSSIDNEANRNLTLTSSKYEVLLSKKYILFVGTLEPRKYQAQVLKAFESLYKNYTDLHLVLIGKIGWNVKKFTDTLNNHPLKNINIHHLYKVNDEELNLFYENAFIVTYLSKYEGYGLPVVESLQRSNITIVSDNSSMKEIGSDYVEYISDDIENKLVDIISLYIKNNNLYTKKREYIKSNYKSPSWQTFYLDLSNTLNKNAQRLK